jgi:hypothetical protein
MRRNLTALAIARRAEAFRQSDAAHRNAGVDGKVLPETEAMFDRYISGDISAEQLHAYIEDLGRRLASVGSRAIE